MPTNNPRSKSTFYHTFQKYLTYRVLFFVQAVLLCFLYTSRVQPNPFHLVFIELCINLFFKNYFEPARLVLFCFEFFFFLVFVLTHLTRNTSTLDKSILKMKTVLDGFFIRFEHFTEYEFINESKIRFE